MRTIDVASAIERAKTLQGFKRDSDLASWLEVSRTSLASWKRRNSIPAKYLFKMVAGTAATVDWLTTGLDEPATDEWGLATQPPLIDAHILWLALLLYRRDLGAGNEKDKKLAKHLDDEALSYFHIHLNNYITLMNSKKEKWLQSGIVKEEDIYRAIATEFDLGLFDFPPTPWWEDKNLV